MNYLGIPTIDCEDYLMGTLATISSKYLFKVLLINNGKPWEDRLFTHYGNPTYESCKIIENRRNPGISVSWNQIIKWALSYNDCKSIFILNDDIELHPDCLDYMVEALDKFDITGAYETKDLSIEKEPRYVGGVHFSCFAMKPEVPRTIGFFDEKYTPFHVEDTDYWKRLIDAGFKSGTDRRAKFIHYKIRPRGDAKRWIENGREITVREIHNRNRRYFTEKHGESPKKWYGRSVEGSRR